MNSMCNLTGRSLPTSMRMLFTECKECLTMAHVQSQLQSESLASPRCLHLKKGSLAGVDATDGSPARYAEQLAIAGASLTLPLHLRFVWR